MNKTTTTTTKVAKTNRLPRTMNRKRRRLARKRRLRQVRKTTRVTRIINNNTSTQRKRNRQGYQKFMRIIRNDATSMVVTGMDLVYSVPELEQLDPKTQVLTIIPSNPAYWVGTRVASIASSYQKFRPLKFTVHYVPIVSYLQQGNVFGGTLWDNLSISKNQIQQTLVTTPGGLSTQACKPKSATVRCKGNLSKNLYSIGGQLDELSNPFYYVAIGVGNFSNEQRVTPGFFWVSYTYSFKNPVGMTTHYSNSGPVALEDVLYRENTTALLCNYKEYDYQLTKKKLDMFTEIQIETTPDGDLVTTYNGSYVPISEEDRLWVFQNYSANTEQFQKVFTINVTSEQQVAPDENMNIQIPSYKWAFVNHLDNICYLLLAGAYGVTLNKNNDTYVAGKIDDVYLLNNNELSMFNAIPTTLYFSDQFKDNNALRGDFYITYIKKTSEHQIKVVKNAQHKVNLDINKIDEDKINEDNIEENDIDAYEDIDDELEEEELGKQAANVIRPTRAAKIDNLKDNNIKQLKIENKQNNKEKPNPKQ